MKPSKEPKTLIEAIRYFSDPDVCLQFLIPIVWPEGVTCPHCGAKDAHFIATRRIWRCKNRHDKQQFSIKVDTIFEDSPIPLDKWMVATWLIANCKNGISSCEVAKDLGITQKSAWFMLHRVRLAMHTGSFRKFGGNSGEVEVDETFIGGKARNMHMDVKKRRITGTGTKDKTAVMGILERGNKDKGTHSRVRTAVVPDRKKKTLQAEVKASVQAGAALYSDFLLSYEGLDSEYAHQVVDHAVEYVRGKVHTNGLENFWSLLKRGLSGTYVSVEPFHLFRYLDEQTFRYNNRGHSKAPVNDFERFKMVLSHIAGKRLTYKDVTGKLTARPAEVF
jgi:ISXO2 transposase-like protein/transposase-like zinc ribbon protein